MSRRPWGKGIALAIEVVGVRRRTRFAQVPLGGEGIHGEAAVRGVRRGIPAVFTGQASDVLQRRGLSACAPATLATGQAAERCRLSGEPGPGAARVGATPSRLLTRVSAHASGILREQSQRGATAAARSPAMRGQVCKDGRVKAAFARAFRDLPDRAGECRGVCKDGRVDRGNDFDIKAIRGTGGRFAKDDLIGAAALTC
jgi:hypothetical protein